MGTWSTGHMSHKADVKPGGAVHSEFRGSLRMSHAFQEQLKKFVIILGNYVYQTL